MDALTFDWEECLRLSNNKEDIAKELLSLLEKELPTYQSEFKQAIQSNDLEKLQRYCHKLHGACCYIGVPQLRTLVNQLAAQIKSGRKNQLTILVNQINSEIDLVMKAIEKV